MLWEPASQPGLRITRRNEGLHPDGLQAFCVANQVRS